MKIFIADIHSILPTRGIFYSKLQAKRKFMTRKIESICNISLHVADFHTLYITKKVKCSS